MAVVGETVYVGGDSPFAIRTGGEDRVDGVDADETPGFTAGTSIAGGALALEWLRRRTGDDE